MRDSTEARVPCFNKMGPWQLIDRPYKYYEATREQDTNATNRNTNLASDCVV